MGACMAVANAGKPLLDEGFKDGTEKDYYSRFIEDKVLGTGSFGQVKQVFEVEQSRSDTPYACKILHKGLQFKDNTLYSPINRSALKAECVILRTLKGEHHTIKLEALFENSSYLWLVMEFCAGGEMMEYIVKQSQLRTEDVSRIAFELLDAVNHCEKHGIIHRDLKPENIMFKHSMAGAPLRLIDFGSSCIASETEGVDKPITDENGLPLVQHSTFAGSAFYISPELFQRTYTYKTDIWSVGVTLYVLVAGFPSEKLQKAFNTLHMSKDRDLRSLPGMDNEDLPDSYFDMLDELLRYRHKQRKCAKDMLEHEFVQFHKVHREGGAPNDEEQGLNINDVAAEAASEGAPLEMSVSGAPGRGKLRRTLSVSIRGTVERHTMYMGYQNFERSVTALLATLLSKEQLNSLIEALKQRLEKVGGHDNKLQVIKVRELKKIMESLNLTSTIQTMNKLPNSNMYNDFAYRVPLLHDFMRRENDEAVKGGSAGMARSQSAAWTNAPSSVHGNDVFEKWRKGSKKKAAFSQSTRNFTSQSAELNFSSHI